MVGNYKMENILSADELNKQGLDADKAGDKAKAFELYRKAAAMGHASAQYNLGLCYGNGEGVKQDYRKAAKWYRKVAQKVPATQNLWCTLAIGYTTYSVE